MAVRTADSTTTSGRSFMAFLSRVRAAVVGSDLSGATGGLVSCQETHEAGSPLSIPPSNPVVIEIARPGANSGHAPNCPVVSRVAPEGEGPALQVVASWAKVLRCKSLRAAWRAHCRGRRANVMGVDQDSAVRVLEDPLTKKGTAFTEEERSEF